MDFLTDWLTNWLKELLISGIMGNLEGLFDTVNAKVGEIAVQVGTTPAAWMLIMMLGAVDTVMLSQYSDNSVAAVGFCHLPG